MKVALLLIDLQKDFFQDSAVGSKENEKIIPNIVKLLRASRKKRIPTIHVRWVIHENTRTMPLRRMERKVTDWCRDEEGAGPVNRELGAENGEYLVEKSTYSGFFNTNLSGILKRHNVKTLILAGIYTNMCLFATALDATYRGYKVIIPKECVASRRSGVHEEYLRNIDENIGEVSSLEKVLEMVS